MVTEKNSRAKRELNKVQVKTKDQKLNLKDKIDLSKNNFQNTPQQMYTFSWKYFFLGYEHCHSFKVGWIKKCPFLQPQFTHGGLSNQPWSRLF